MEILRNVLLILHILGFAGIIAGVLMQLPAVKQGAAKINGAILHSSILMLVTGLALVGVAYGRGFGDEVDNAKIGVKSLVLIVILVLAIVGKVKKRAGAGLLGAIGGLAVLNVILAVAW
ncbi:MAG: hypothetical protein ACNYNX_12680 [Leucobacter sp.]